MRVCIPSLYVLRSLLFVVGYQQQLPYVHNDKHLIHTAN
jgi:hypothetical protein